MTVLAYQRTGDLQKVAQQLITNLASSGAAGTGADAVGYTPPGAGAVATTVGADLNYQLANIGRFGTLDPTGSADMTAIIQAALNSGLKSIFIPAGTFAFSSLTMPTTNGFVLKGLGTASILKQTGTGIVWPANPSLNFNEQYISDLSFIGTNGTGHTIDTSYQGGLTLQNIYLTDVPVGFDGIHIDGSSTTYTHDVRVLNYQCYSNTAGHAAIGLGAHCADSEIDRFIMNGNFVTLYGMYCADGSQTTKMSNSHPYNCATNIVWGTNSTTGAKGFSFVNVTFDNCTNDLVSLTNFVGADFGGCYFEAVKAGKNAVTLTNCTGTMFSIPRFDGAGGSGYIINETGSTDYTNVNGGTATNLSNFTSPPFNFLGAHSVARFTGYTSFGQQIVYTGCTTATVGAGSTVILGPNGAQATAGIDQFMIPLISGCQVLRADIGFTAAPGAGQSYTFTLVGNGSTLTAASGSANPLVISGAGVFTASIIVAQGAGAFLSQFQTCYIQLQTSAGAALSNFRYAIQCIG